MNPGHSVLIALGTRAYPYPGRSTKKNSGWGFPVRRNSKKLMVWVRPGVLLVFAILSVTSELIRLDLPTFERPRNAISGALGAGNCFGSAALVTNWVVTFTLSLWLRCGESASVRVVNRGHRINEARTRRASWIDFSSGY